ncbi:MAG: hypothetical protein HQM16_18955 [Deltaproteobacteria bacterium]|nr:hypothetical protein [Deltaproteobacteria bacterium]
MQKFFLKLMALFVLSVSLSAAMCTKVVTYAKDHRTEAIAHSYSTNIPIAMQQTQVALKSLGYNVQGVDWSTNQITTGWRPVTSDSHYMNLFNRRDYSANSGSYYQLVATCSQESHKVGVSVYTVVKSLTGNLSSSMVVEKKFLGRLDDFMRSPQIEITNVGLTER